VYFATDNALGTTLLIFMLFLSLTGSLRRATRSPDCVRGCTVFGIAILKKVCLPTALGCHLGVGGDFGASPFWAAVRQAIRLTATKTLLRFRSNA
jgi:hypothetical protein